MYDIYCKLRDSKGYKDATVAKATGITKSTFSDWKYGRSTPKREKLQKIANFFGVPLDYLIGSDNQIYSESSAQLSSESDDNALRNEPEYIIRNLTILIDHNSEMTYKYYSSLCRSERINKDITERRLTQISNVPLDKYLDFELNQAQLEPEDLLQILIALEIDPLYSISYLQGSFAAMIKTEEDREKFIDATFDGNKASKKVISNILALEADDLDMVLKELERLTLIKGKWIPSKDAKFEKALKDSLVNTISADYNADITDNTFTKMKD